MPAEWAPHEATWLAWPHNRSDWPGKFEPIPYVYAEIVRNLARGERVEIIVQDEAHEAKAREVLRLTNVLAESGKSLRFHRWPTNRGWLRDSGPIFVTRNTKEAPRVSRQPLRAPRLPQSADVGTVALTNWRFNAWAKYDDCKHDDKLPSIVADRLKVERYEVFGLNDADEYQRFVLEGGSIDVNGAGCVLTTEQCLLNPNRNPDLTRADVEAMLHRYLGTTQVVWLGDGIVGDDTDGHIDDLTRFVDERTVVTVVEANGADPNHAPLAANLERLRGVRLRDGQRLTVVEVPMPDPVFGVRGRLPASYANFYVGNDVVILPVFAAPQDARGIDVLAQCFPTRRIVPIDARALVVGLGTFHCLTQQIPVAS
jgi:agmatine deiminase